MKRFRPIETDFADNQVNGKARDRFRRGLYDIGDGVYMHLICPTRQGRRSQIEPGDIETEPLGRFGIAGGPA